MFFILYLYSHFIILLEIIVYLFYNIFYKIIQVLFFIYNISIYFSHQYKLIKFFLLFYLYLILFPIIIIIYLCTHSLGVILFLFNFEFRKLFKSLQFLFSVFIIIYCIGYIKSYLFINWFLLFSFYKFYVLNKKNINTLDILILFFYDITSKYRLQIYSIINIFIIDIKNSFSQNNFFLYVFIYDILSFLLLLILFFLYFY